MTPGAQRVAGWLGVGEGPHPPREEGVGTNETEGDELLAREGHFPFLLRGHPAAYIVCHAIPSLGGGGRPRHLVLNFLIWTTSGVSVPVSVPVALCVVSVSPAGRARQVNPYNWVCTLRYGVQEERRKTAAGN